jgi:hypothetical protein
MLRSEQPNPVVVRERIRPEDAVDMFARSLPSWPRERIERMLERFMGLEEDGRYIAENRAELTKLYPDEWIAVVDKVVVAHGRDSKQLWKQLKKRGLDGSCPATEILWTHPPRLLL